MASNDSHIAWLRDQLPSLISAGILTDDAAQRLREHYDAEGRRSGVNGVVVIFSILGALLIGGGIILLIGHNWDQLDRPMRAVLAFVPLLLCQGLAFWLLWTGSQSTAWRESVGTALSLSVGAAMALISQTYNLGGSFSTFMLAWTLLSLPTAYLLRATLPALWYIGAALLWVFNVPWRSELEIWFFPLLSLVVPLWWLENRENPARMRPALLGLGLGIAAGLGTITVGIFNNASSAWPIIWCYGGLATTLFMLARSGIPSGVLLRHRPFHWIGFLGVVSLALVFTFHGEDYRHEEAFQESVLRHVRDYPWEFLTMAFWMVASVGLWVRCLLKGGDTMGVLVGSFVPVTLVLGLTGSVPAVAITVLMNGYVLTLGVVAIVRGMNTQRLSVVNAGLLTIAAVLLCRFFEAEIGFVVKAVCFILLGVGFLVTNLMIVRKLKPRPAP